MSWQLVNSLMHWYLYSGLCSQVGKMLKKDMLHGACSLQLFPQTFGLQKDKSYSTSLRVLVFVLLLSCLWAASLYAGMLEITLGVVEIRLHNDPSWPWTYSLAACCATGLDNHAWLQRLQVAPHTLRHRLCAGLTATDGADSVEEKYDFEKYDFVRRTLGLPKGHR